MSFSSSNSIDPSAVSRFDAAVSDFFVARDDELDLHFGYGPLNRFADLIARLNAGASECAYILLADDPDGDVAREGRTGKSHKRLSNHHGSLEARSYDRVALVTGPDLTEEFCRATEALLSRQIRAVGRAIHPSQPEMPEIDPPDWALGAEVFMFFRRVAPLAGITCLEPMSPKDPAAYGNCLAGHGRKLFPGAIEIRKARILRSARVEGPRFEMDWGDYIALAEQRGDRFWLLAGSEFRKDPVKTSRGRHRDLRDQLRNARGVADVAGYPDRLRLRVDAEIGYSLDNLTKFVKGSASGERCWRELPVDPRLARHSLSPSF